MAKLTDDEIKAIRHTVETLSGLVEICEEVVIHQKVEGWVAHISEQRDLDQAHAEALLLCGDKKTALPIARRVVAAQIFVVSLHQAMEGLGRAQEDKRREQKRSSHLDVN